MQADGARALPLPLRDAVEGGSEDLARIGGEHDAERHHAREEGVDLDGRVDEEADDRLQQDGAAGNR